MKGDRCWIALAGRKKQLTGKCTPEGAEGGAEGPQMPATVMPSHSRLCPFGPLLDGCGYLIPP